MKKYWLAFLLALLPFKLHAAITDEGVTREKTVFVHVSTSVAANTTSTTPLSYLLISLSTTTGFFPHTVSDGQGEIDISHINIQSDKVAASSGTVRIGVVTFVNTSSASVTFFNTNSNAKNVSNTNTSNFQNYTPSFARCRVTGTETTPFIMSNEKRNGTTIYNSTTSIQSTIGNIPPRVGDIIMEATNSDMTNTISLIVDLWYHSEK